MTRKRDKTPPTAEEQAEVQAALDSLVREGKVCIVGYRNAQPLYTAVPDTSEKH